jgi:hypothetical protein
MEVPLEGLQLVEQPPVRAAPRVAAIVVVAHRPQRRQGLPERRVLLLVRVHDALVEECTAALRVDAGGE